MKIQLSFKEHEKFMYDYVKEQFSYSAYIKQLIINDMKSKKIIKGESENGRK